MEEGGGVLFARDGDAGFLRVPIHIPATIMPGNCRYKRKSRNHNVPDVPENIYSGGWIAAHAARVEC
jgi:hypothetical protein